jgi:hypothetical protein
MSFETYWLAAPLVGIAATIPFWVWLWVTRHHGSPSVPPAHRKSTKRAN